MAASVSVCVLVSLCVCVCVCVQKMQSKECNTNRDEREGINLKRQIIILRSIEALTRAEREKKRDRGEKKEIEGKKIKGTAGVSEGQMLREKEKKYHRF